MRAEFQVYCILCQCFSSCKQVDRTVRIGLVRVRVIGKIKEKSFLRSELTSSIFCLTIADSSPVAFKYKSGRAARSGRVEAHGKGEIFAKNNPQNRNLHAQFQ